MIGYWGARGLIFWRAVAIAFLVLACYLTVAQAQAAPPVANYTVTCTGTSRCDFDARASTGAIIGYQWCAANYTNCSAEGQNNPFAGWGPWPLGTAVIALQVTDRAGQVGRVTLAFPVTNGISTTSTSGAIAATPTPRPTLTPTASPSPTTTDIIVTVIPVVQTPTSTPGIAPAACSLGFDRSAANVNSGGLVTGIFQVQATPGCPWTAAPTVPWISVASPFSGTGPGFVVYSVLRNPGGPRDGGVVIGVEDQNNVWTEYEIHQAGVGS